MKALPEPKFQMGIYQTLGKESLKNVDKRKIKIKDLTATFPDPVDANEGCSER